MQFLYCLLRLALVSASVIDVAKKSYDCGGAACVNAAKLLQDQCGERGSQTLNVPVECLMPISSNCMNVPKIVKVYKSKAILAQMIIRKLIAYKLLKIIIFQFQRLLLNYHFSFQISCPTTSTASYSCSSTYPKYN